jgi:hypothetical protein
MTRSPFVWILALLGALSGCRPQFKPEGALTVAGAAFVPVRCRALGQELGVELATAEGAMLTLVLPWSRLDAFREVKGEPHLVFQPVGAAAVEAERCGTLMLRGEGYHGEGKRAASGQLSLSCEAGKGELSFSGCF